MSDTQSRSGGKPVRRLTEKEQAIYRKNVKEARKMVDAVVSVYEKEGMQPGEPTSVEQGGSPFEQEKQLMQALRESVQNNAVMLQLLEKYKNENDALVKEKAVLEHQLAGALKKNTQLSNELEKANEEKHSLAFKLKVLQDMMAAHNKA